MLVLANSCATVSPDPSLDKVRLLLEQRGGPKIHLWSSAQEYPQVDKIVGELLSCGITID